METKIEMIENFLTKKSESSKATALVQTLFLVLLLIVGTSLFLNDFFKADSWMPASFTSVFVKEQWWKPWTTLFAHGYLTHVGSNLFLFIPFAYFLSTTFSFWLFPFMGFLFGGLINLIVLTTLSPETSLIGVSGVVYWMGACWITLSFFIDLRETLTRRIIKSTGIALILFFPQTLKPEVSYLSHFLGSVFGVLSGTAYYFLNRKKIRSADVYRITVEPEFELEPEEIYPVAEDHSSDAVERNSKFLQ